MWELPSWQSFYGLTPSDWPMLREAVRDALGGGPLTREELGAAVTARPKFRHLGCAFADGSGTLLKPFAWQGDLSFGPPRDGRATFQRLDVNPRWAGVPDLEAGMRAVEAYFLAYGPATPDHVRYWLGHGLGAGRKRIQSWISGLGDRLTAVDIDGQSAYLLREDLEELATTPTTTAVRLLPRYDQWVLGPGTADAHVVPPATRTVVSRGPNIVIVGGIVAGTWSLIDNQGRRCLVRRSRATRAGSAGRGGCAARHYPRPAPAARSTNRMRASPRQVSVGAVGLAQSRRSF